MQHTISHSVVPVYSCT